jgi:hypothetical protein
MNRFPGLMIWQRRRILPPRSIRADIGRVVFLVLVLTQFVQSQSRESANAGRILLSVGAGVSGYTFSHEDRGLGGITAVIDADSIRHIGIEGECRWLEFHQVDNVHVETCAVGPRFHFNAGRFQPYAKGLVGFANYNDRFGFERNLIIAPGGGADYRLSSHWSLRIVDFEY